MTLTVFLAVLCAAAMHAIWNAVIKVRLDRFGPISLMTLGAAAAASPVLPFVDLPQVKVWFWIVLSAAIHTGYRLFLIKAYETGALAELKKWVLRNRALAAAVVAGILLLIAGLASTSYVQTVGREKEAAQKVIALQEKERADAAAWRAQENSVLAEANATVARARLEEFGLLSDAKTLADLL